MSKQVTFFFDYVSPFSYFAHTQLPAFVERTGAELTYVPVLLGGIFKATGNKPPVMDECEPKRNYFGGTIGRWVKHYGVPFQMNPHFPVNTVNAMRGAIAAQSEGVFDRYHAALFQAVWVDGRNAGDPDELADVLTKADLDAARLLEVAGGEEARGALRANTEAAVAAGAFGVPTFVHEGEIYWGADHMHFLEASLAG